MDEGPVLERAAWGNRPVEAVPEMSALLVEEVSVERLRSVFGRVARSLAWEQR